jgi:thiol-disulfide isomerase/thioredoxin
MFLRPCFTAILLVVLFMGTVSSRAQQATVVKFDALQKILASNKDEIHIINFWATWCAPCVKELPLLEKLNAEGLEKVKITLISLDYADKVDNVNAFITRKNIKSSVLLLDDVDYNSWIDKVEKQWSGAIPATLIINSRTKERRFLERELKEGELEKLIAGLR